MVRAAIFLILVALLAGGATWIADHPGDVRFTWLGYRIETSIGVLAVGTGIFAVVVVLLARIWDLFRLTPRRLGRMRRESRRRRGYKSLIQGLVAVAAGDAGEAARHARRAESLLAEPELTLLLSAQAAQLTGDTQAAGKYFNAMAARPETEYLGVRGLLNQALGQGNRKRALDLAGQAHRLNPKAEWVARTLFELQVKERDWPAAEATLKEMVKRGHLDAEEGKRRRAALYAERGRDADRAGRIGEALDFTRQAHKLWHGLVPAAVLMARLYGDTGKRDRAVTAIEECWAENPHPRLLEIHEALSEGTEPGTRLFAAKKLAQFNRDHPESHIAVARAALDAEAWEDARRHLEAAGGNAPNARVCRYMSELEEREGHADAARDWLDRASRADPDSAWVCEICNDSTPEWELSCGHCGGFLTRQWRVPDRIARLAPPAAEPPVLDTVGIEPSDTVR
jgi:HemY protein